MNKEKQFLTEDSKNLETLGRKGVWNFYLFLR